MRVLFIVNPVAGGGRGLRVWRAVERALLERGCPAEHRFTGGRGAATELAAEVRRAGYDRVVGIGGDGTIQEIVNGLLDEEARCPTALAVIPGGTGNDFSKMLGYPQNPLKALEVALGGRELTLDVGRIGRRYFINIAGVGFDAEVAAFLNLRPKRLPGVLTYLFGVLVMLFRYRPAPLELAMDDLTLKEKCLLVSVCNGHSHAGGMKMCPGARPDDGVLDICVAGNLSRLETLMLLPRVFWGGHTRHRKVRLYRTTEIRIASRTPLHVQADGEVLGRLPAEIRIVPGALRVIGPPAAGAVT
ncbi:MAG TPA: hypothetical protein DHW14_09080 [Clostridiales bacterium]|nr:hypothetical protein [Clostridiales bacterium]